MRPNPSSEFSQPQAENDQFLYSRVFSGGATHPA